MNDGGYQFVLTLKELTIAGTVIVTSLVTIGSYVYRGYKQLIPNSGSSLRDAVDKITLKLDKMMLSNRVYLDNIEHTPMFETDKDGKCEWVNKAYLNLTGKTMNELIGNNWGCSIHQDDRDMIEKEWERTASRNRNFDMIYRFVNANGEVIQVHCQAWGDETKGYFGIVKKI